MVPLEHKQDYLSVSRALIDRGVEEGTNEVVLLYEPRKGFLRKKPTIHVAIYPAGTWEGFFEAVKKYEPQAFRWPTALIYFQPGSTAVFPSSGAIRVE